VPCGFDSPVTFTLVSGELPEGLTLVEGTGVIAGVPTDVMLWAVKCVVKCENASGGCLGEVSLVVNPAKPLLRLKGLDDGTLDVVKVEAPGGKYLKCVKLRRGTKVEPLIEFKDINKATTFTCDNLPKGLEINAATGAVGGYVCFYSYELFSSLITASFLVLFFSITHPLL